jgi:hypothetical protein
MEWNGKFIMKKKNLTQRRRGAGKNRIRNSDSLYIYEVKSLYRIQSIISLACLESIIFCSESTSNEKKN